MEVYQPLSIARNEIRLLQPIHQSGHPKPREVRLEFTISHVSLDDGPEYCCLSYVWGSSEKVLPILLNNVTVHVTQSLGEALTSLYNVKDLRYLWADSLCINQALDDANAIKERNAQVQMMGCIYSKAQAVYSWLGPRDVNSIIVMGEINNGGGKILSRAEPQFPLDFDHADPVWSYKLGEVVMHHALKDDLFDMLVRDMRWNSLGTPRLPWSTLAWKNFLARPYWNRVWILQEILCAKRCYLVCGSDIAPLGRLLVIESLTRAMLRSRRIMSSIPECCMEEMQKGNDLLALLSQTSILATLHSWLNGSVWKNDLAATKDSLSMLDLLEMTRLMETSEPHDRIYALIGIASDAAELNIEVNYRQTMKDVLINLTKRMLDRYGLEVTYYPSKGSLSTEHPSWVSISRYFTNETNSSGSWGLRRLRSIFFNPDDNYVDYKFSTATKLSKNMQDLNFQYQDGNHLLCFSGFRVGDVVSVKAVRRRWQNVDGILTVGHQNILDLDHFAKSLGHLPNLWWLPILHRDPKSAPLSVADRYSETHKQMLKSYDTLCQGSPPTMRCTSNAMALERQKWKGDLYGVISACSLENRTFFITSSGHVGVGSQVHYNDIVIVCPGVSVPYVFRPTSNGRYRFQGEAYVLGIMHGEFLDTNPDLERFLVE